MRERESGGYHVVLFAEGRALHPVVRVALHPLRFYLRQAFEFGGRGCCGSRPVRTARGTTPASSDAEAGPS